ncbi:hypothetical protein C0214_18470 [Methylobacterium sp. DM1]|nr:hypothetical protein C0214_18470 [Methylobacterium sp. DM1]
MHQASLPSTQTQWRKIYQTMGVSGPNSSCSLRSPTLAAVRVYLNEIHCEPSPAEIIKHLKVLLRGPTSIDKFMHYIERKIHRKRGENKDMAHAMLESESEKISKTTIQNEIILISHTVQSITNRDNLLYLSRLLSPIPEPIIDDRFISELIPAQMDQIDFDEKLRPFSIDLKQLYENIKPLLPIAGNTVTEESGQKVVDIITRCLPNDQGEAFIIVLYRLILNRKPDLPGYEDHISDLKSGDFSYIDILNRFLGSEEFTLSAKTMEEDNDRG